MRQRLLFISIILFSCTSHAKIQYFLPQNFNQAKSVIYNLLIQDLETIYSGCKINADKKIDFASCNFIPYQTIVRDQRIELEHILPMAHAKFHFQCWREPVCVDKNGHKFKGRRCCQQIDPKFRQLEGELYNLWPEIGEINRARSCHKFTEFTASERQTIGLYRNLPVYIDFKHRRIEPREAVKGLVARSNLFVASKYKIRLSKAQLK